MEFWNSQPEMTRCLTRVHNVMKEQIPEKGRFSGIISDLVENPGKMLRPALLILCAGLDKHTEAAARLAAALEYLHVASLVHDDIIDGAVLRRGRPSVVSAHGLSKAIYTGDYLIWLAVNSLSGLKPDELPLQPAGFMSPLLEAEAEQLESRFSTVLTEAAYLKRIEAKTGQLFALAASAGRNLVTKSEAQLETAKQAGLSLGIAFQLRDDLLDFEDPTYSDLKDGNYTHPVLSALEAQPALAELLARAAGEGKTANYAAVVARVRQQQGPDRTRQVMLTYLEKSTRLFDGMLSEEERAVFNWMTSRLFGGHHEN